MGTKPLQREPASCARRRKPWWSGGRCCSGPRRKPLPPRFRFRPAPLLSRPASGAWRTAASAALRLPARALLCPWRTALSVGGPLRKRRWPAFRPQPLYPPTPASHPVLPRTVLTVAGPLPRGAYHVVVAAARAPGPRPSTASCLSALRSLPGVGYVAEVGPEAVVAPGVATASGGAEVDLHVDLALPSTWWIGPSSPHCEAPPCPAPDRAARRWARREVGPALAAAVRAECPDTASVHAHSATHRAVGVRVRPAAAALCAARAIAGAGGAVAGVEARRPFRTVQQFSVPLVQSGTLVRAVS